MAYAMRERKIQRKSKIKNRNESRKFMRNFTPTYVHELGRNFNGELRVSRSLNCQKPPLPHTPVKRGTSCFELLGDSTLLETEILSGAEIKGRADVLIEHLKPHVEKILQDPLRNQKINYFYLVD